ncbi:hypothetical protein J2X36_005246 [Methylobacterium sp. BE186]|uniref:hypothetical protein n=1 Tax=Methylobacterium sp. BE186 TaxID=2817715 RepID=UPI002864338D|nr:hypothetical protein [Methylobacterium sp. BE186]MDR7040463.1 hypothetical protein [Methylobacterium sp. BE186]
MREPNRVLQGGILKFMKSTAAAVLMVGLLTNFAIAKSFELPESKPIVTITLPDAWEPEEIAKGVQANSPDTGIYVAFEIGNVKNTDKVVLDGVKFLAESGVKIDPASEKRGEGKINGIDMIDINWTGDYDGKVAKVSLTIAVLSPTKIGLLTYWGSPSAEKKYAAQLDSILKSIQPLGQ